MIMTGIIVSSILLGFMLNRTYSRIYAKFYKYRIIDTVIELHKAQEKCSDVDFDWSIKYLTKDLV